MSGRTVLETDCIREPSGEGNAYTSAGHARWQESKPGIWIKPLYDNPVSGESTLLVRMDAGARSRPHTHDTFEQIYVISGSFDDDERHLEAGDYCCRAPGTVHGASSAKGATLIAIYTRSWPGDPDAGRSGA